MSNHSLPPKKRARRHKKGEKMNCESPELFSEKDFPAKIRISGGPYDGMIITRTGDTWHNGTLGVPLSCMKRSFRNGMYFWGDLFNQGGK
jgi:hypothetical protein